MAAKVLVAEDDELNRELIRVFLEPHGYQIDTVDDGFEAVAAVRSTDYDLVIMDTRMPGMDGLESTKAIRALGGRYERLPILAFSANILPDQIKRCLDAGMTAYLTKPFTPESLSAAVRRLAPPPAPPNEVLAAFELHAGREAVCGLLRMLRDQIIAFQACKPSDAADVRRQAHALGDAAAALGFGDLALICREIEQTAERPALASILPLALDAAANVSFRINAELQRAL